MEPLSFEALLPYAQWILEPLWPFIMILGGLMMGAIGWQIVREALLRRS